MKRGLLVSAWLVICFIFASPVYAVTYPFPQNTEYDYGIRPSTVDADAVQSIYETWLNAYYEESGDLARIKFDNPGETVSEGVAYGMLIMVFIDNTDNDTQAKFDKLWKYYNTFLNHNGLMHWKINGFSGVAGQNAATDAEMDAALALMMAYKQWGDVQYLEDAKELIAKIREHEVNANRYLKPGDMWDDKKNPSYFSIVALKLFAQIDTGYADFWNEVIANSYSLIKASRNSTTGLVPDWCSESGTPYDPFKYDAVRVPWRMIWAYLWYGDADAYGIADKMSDWMKTTVFGDPAQIKDGYNLDGSIIGGSNNPTFVGAFATAAMVGSQHQDWLNASYAHLVSFSGNETYFNKTLQVLYALLATGNMPNFWEDAVTPENRNGFLPVMLLLLL